MKFSIAAIFLSSLVQVSNAQTIADIVASDPEFSNLLGAISSVPGLGETLAGPGPFTVFAPPNEAFVSIPEDFLLKISADPESWVKHIEDLLLFHAISGAALSTDLSDGQVLDMLNGGQLTVSLADGVSLSSAAGANAVVIGPDIAADNGVVHVIGSVLAPDFAFTPLPAVVEADPELSTLLDLVVQEGLGDALTTMDATILAPTNAAFEEFLADPAISEAIAADPSLVSQVLLYHVIPAVVPSSAVTPGDAPTAQGATIAVTTDGGGVQFNGDSNAIETDILAFNGIIHKIDRVLVPPLDGPTPEQPTPPVVPEQPTPAVVPEQPTPAVIAPGPTSPPGPVDGACTLWSFQISPDWQPLS